MPLRILGFKKFKHPDLRREIRSEPDRLGDDDPVRVIDALGIRKGVDSEVEVLDDGQLGAASRPRPAPQWAA